MPEDGNRHRQLAKLVERFTRWKGDERHDQTRPGNMAEISMQLRKFMDESGCSTYALAKGSGVNIDSLYRFRRGESDLSLAAAEKLAEFLGLKLVTADGGDVGKTGPKAKASPKKPKAAAKKATPKRTKQ